MVCPECVNVARPLPIAKLCGQHAAHQPAQEITESRHENDNNRQNCRKSLKIAKHLTSSACCHVGALSAARDFAGAGIFLPSMVVCSVLATQFSYWHRPGNVDMFRAHHQWPCTATAPAQALRPRTASTLGALYRLHLPLADAAGHSCSGWQPCNPCVRLTGPSAASLCMCCQACSAPAGTALS